MTAISQAHLRQSAEMFRGAAFAAYARADWSDEQEAIIVRAVDIDRRHVEEVIARLTPRDADAPAQEGHRAFIALVEELQVFISRNTN